MNFNTRQRKIINARDSKILCLASPAAGKTRVLTERIKDLITKDNVPTNEIFAITFTNMAAEEMRRRLEDVAGDMFIGTLHSFANKICIMNNIKTLSDITLKEFDNIIKKAIKIARKNYPKIKHILIDECQDLSELEYMFLSRIPAENYFYVGDDRQSIYGFKGCSDKYLRQMWQDPEYKKYYLTENYRNAPNIIDFAEGFLGSFGSLSPHSIPAKTKLGNLYTDDNFLDAVNDIEDSQNWGSWFVLTRTNDESDEAQRILTEREIPNISFKKGSLEINDLDEIMSSNKVKVLTIHQSKGLESPNVVVIGARAFNEEERKVAYVAATRAENTLYWCPTIVKRKRKTVKTKNYDIINKRKEEGMIEF